MEDLARPIKFQSTESGTTTITIRDALAFAAKILSLIPGLSLIVLFVAGLILQAAGIDTSKANFVLIGSMNAIFVSMLILTWISGQSFDFNWTDKKRMTCAYFAEVFWFIILITAL
jgi:hypothetical protein